MDTLENPNSQDASDLQTPGSPRVVYPAKTNMEFKGMDINVGPNKQPEIPSSNSYIGPTPAPRQNVPSAGADFLGSIADSIIPSASANEDARSAMLQRVGAQDIASDIKGIETDFTVSEKDVLGAEEYTRNKYGIKSKYSKSGIESSVGKNYKLKISQDGSVFFKNGKSDSWKPISSDPVVSRAFEKRMDFIGTLIDSPAMAAGALSVPVVGAAGMAPMLESIGAAGSVGRVFGSAGSNFLTQSSPLGEAFASTVEDPVLVDYFLKHKGKTPAIVSAALEGAGQVGGEFLGGLFSRSAKTNRAYSLAAKQIEEASGRIPTVSGSGSGVMELTPGQRALGVPFADEIVDLELEAAKDPAVRSYLVNKNVQQAKQLDDAVDILKSRYKPQQAPASSIKTLTKTKGGVVENFLERDLKAATEGLKRNREDLNYAVPNLKNKQIINPTGVLSVIEDALVENFGESIMANGKISEALIAKELSTGSGLAFEGEKDLLKLYLEVKRMTNRGAGSSGLSETISSSSKPIFPESPIENETVSGIQGALTIPEGQGNLFPNQSLGPIPSISTSNQGSALYPAAPLAPETISKGVQYQPSLTGRSFSADVPNELKSFSSFKRSIGQAAKGLDDADISTLYNIEKAKYIKARSYLTGGAPGVYRESNLTFPQFSSIVDRAQNIGAFESAISSKTPAQRSAAEMSGILRLMEDDVMTDLAVKNGITDLAQRIVKDKETYSSRLNQLIKVKKALDTDFLTKTFLNLETNDAELLVGAMSKDNIAEFQTEVLDDLFKKAHFNKKMYTVGRDGQFEGFDRGKFFRETMNNPRASKNLELLFGKDALKEIVDLGKVAERIDLYGPVLEKRTKDLMLGQLEKRGYSIATSMAKNSGVPAYKFMQVIDQVFKMIVPQGAEDLAEKSNIALSKIARRLYEKEINLGKRVTPKLMAETMKSESDSAAIKAIKQERASKALIYGVPGVIKLKRLQD